MSEQQKELIVNMAKYVLTKCMRDKVEVVSFNDIASHCRVSARGVWVVAKYICKVLMTSARVDDVDIYDGDGIMVMLKNSRVRV